MIHLQRILVPTDFSKHSRHALGYAAALADKFAAEIFLLHAVQSLATFFPDPLSVVPPVQEQGEPSTAAVHAAFDQLVRESRLDRFRLHREVREGAPADTIIRFATEANIDLITMGTHGHTGLAHILLGSVAEKVVRAATCPVLTVRHPEQGIVRP